LQQVREPMVIKPLYRDYLYRWSISILVRIERNIFTRRLSHFLT